MPLLDEEGVKRHAGEYDVENVHMLSIANRGLTGLGAICTCVNLTVADLSSNALVNLDGIGELQQLAKLRISDNKISSLEPLARLQKLRELYAEGNAVAHLSEVENLQPSCESLAILYLRRVYEADVQPNPVCSHPSYRSKLITLLPALQNLDGERFTGDKANSLLYTDPAATEGDDDEPLPEIKPAFSAEELRAMRQLDDHEEPIGVAALQDFRGAMQETDRLLASARSLLANYASVRASHGEKA